MFFAGLCAVPPSVWDAEALRRLRSGKAGIFTPSLHHSITLHSLASLPPQERDTHPFAIGKGQQGIADESLLLRRIGQQRQLHRERGCDLNCELNR